LYGSSSQFGIKPGTIDLALVVAACKTLKIYYPQTEEHYQYVKKLNEYLRSKLEKIKYIVINSSVDSSPFIISISVPNINGETLVHILEEQDIYVSTGSACSSKLKKPERTILSITNSVSLATSTIRISISHLTTYQEIDKLIETMEKINYV
jgi:cysteine desulfurase